VPLGTLVLRAGLMPQDRIEEALQNAIASGRKLGEELIERGLEERELVRLLAAQHAQPFVDLTRFPIDWETARLLPPTVAEAHCALPIAQDGESVTVAVPDPEDDRQRERLRRALRRHIRLVAASRGDIKEAIDAFAPRAERLAPTCYDIVTMLVDGQSVTVGTVRTETAAKELAQRVVSLARISSTISLGETTVDGSEVVSVEIVVRAAES
jgi:hypothetical protein